VDEAQGWLKWREEMGPGLGLVSVLFGCGGGVGLGEEILLRCGEFESEFIIRF
jgi:hypothetical protein